MVPLAETLVEHAESLGARGDQSAAEPLLAEATQIFERLRATPWLERARRAAGVVPPVEALA